MDGNLNQLLKRGVAEIIVEEEMTELLRSGKILRLKEGFDPSFPDIHLGHMVALKKLRQFQELGHQVILIVGDWTAQIGDPSGVSVTRPMLSAEQVKANAETYMQQFFKVVDKQKTEVKWQSEWFGKFTLADVIQLTSKFTIAQLLARDDFSTRYREGRPIAITEFLYPLLQAQDSVEIKADVEFGGTDQKFNLLVGRELQSMVGQRPQQCFMTPLLIGTDSSQKMSKSLGNYIGVAEPPEEIYGKVMSITDNLIMDYFELLTDVPDKELEEFRQALAHNTVNPMELKKRLARELVTHLYDKKAASEAEAHFRRIVQEKEVPEEIAECYVRLEHIAASQDSQSKYTPFSDVDVSKLLVQTRLAKSRSEANRLIAQRAVEIDGNRVCSNIQPVKNDSTIIIKAGKRRFAKVKLIL
ncbi:tyrosine--tRNA ligase [Chloroflexota bacterium]